MKIFRSLPKDLEDEAVACFDSQGDQNVFTAKQIFDLPDTQERAHRKMELFYFVFGYAQAKGWTNIDDRLASRRIQLEPGVFILSVPK